MQFATRLRLDDKLVVHNQIEPLYPERSFLVDNPYGHFAGYTVPSRVEFSLHGPHVKVLEKAISERVINFEERTDNGVRESLFDQLDMRHPVVSGDQGHHKIIKLPPPGSFSTKEQIRSISPDQKHPC